MKVVHIITGLNDGGAEHTLFKICKYNIVNKHIVISLSGSGKYFPLLNKLGIDVYFLNLKIFQVYKIFFLIKLIRSLKPDLVQTWLVHADFFGGIAARLAGIKKVIWNVRYSDVELGKTKILTILIMKILVLLSFIIPKLIIINSKRGIKLYEAKGYDKKKLRLIQNGYDLSILKINKTKKKRFRKKIKIKKQIPLIGNVARFDPKKDHSNLLHALSLLKYKNINFFCVLVGSKIQTHNTKLISEIKRFKLLRNIKLLGQSNDITEVMNGIDIYVQSSSFGEGFPNVVAESMACGTPCVVTDVGDALNIVGKTGWVVPPKNPYKLAKGIEKGIYEMQTKQLDKKSHKARLRIKKNFEIMKMVKSYNNLWDQIHKKNN
ncbi:glycosyltransferase [Pelagibacterales bacterium SAG-MED50]|nr:glycosyltransferase [Pelagibacterales bacterium SAG-MED50]